MTALELALMFLKDRHKVRLSEKQVKWLNDLRTKQGDGLHEGTIGFDGDSAIKFKQGKRMFAAVGGLVGRRGNGKFFLERSSNP